MLILIIVDSVISILKWKKRKKEKIKKMLILIVDSAISILKWKK
jgi:hypothetical protein